MKFVILLLVNVIALQAAPVSQTSSAIEVNDLFDTAWKFQDKLNPRQSDIDNDVTEFRNSVSNVLKTTSKNALKEVEDNAKRILDLENPVRTSIDGLKVGDCSSDLKKLLNGITGFTGYKSSNCVKLYDYSVDVEVQQAQDLISVYDGIFTELQQLVVKSFVGKNQFNQQAEIIERFEQEYEKRVAAWEAIKPDVELFIENLSGNIEAFNDVMHECMVEIQQTVLPSYELLKEDIETCIIFENTPNPFRKSYKLKSLAELIPNEDLSVL
jgi:hypothetical protein